MIRNEYTNCALIASLYSGLQLSIIACRGQGLLDDLRIESIAPNRFRIQIEDQQSGVTGYQIERSTVLDSATWETAESNWGDLGGGRWGTTIDGLIASQGFFRVRFKAMLDREVLAMACSWMATI